MRFKILQYLVAALLVLAAGYIFAYFALARHAQPHTVGILSIESPVIQDGKIVTLIETYPDYHGFPQKLFRPIHFLDSEYTPRLLVFDILRSLAKGH